MMLPYEILVAIAMDNWGSFKALFMADRRMVSLLSRVPKSRFTIYVNNRDTAYKLRHDYYRVYCETYATGSKGIRIYQGSLIKAITYTVDNVLNITRPYGIARVIIIDKYNYYREQVNRSMVSGIVHSIMRTWFTNGDVLVEEIWDKGNNTHTIKRRSGNLNNKFNTDVVNVDGIGSPKWVITHPRFIW